MSTSRSWILGLVLLVAACSKDKEPVPPGPGVKPAGGGTEKVQPSDPVPGDDVQDDTAQQAQREALRKQKSELAARVEQAEADLQRIIKEGDRKRDELPDVSKYRRRLASLMRDRNVEGSKLRTMEKQFEEVKKYAESNVTGELKALREEEQKLDKGYNEALSGFKQDAQDAAQGVTEETPVQRELAVLRTVKQKWFEATPLSRRGGAGESERKIINDGFRAWLGELPQRRSLVSKALTLEIAPKGKSPESYDFTQLDFFVLLEVLEDTLDRANFVVEKKVISENLDAVRRIEKQLEQVREKIAQKMQEGGGELERYEDLASRIPGMKQKVDSLESAVAAYRRIFEEAQAQSDAIDQAENDARQAIDDAKKEYRDAVAKLRQLGG